MKEQELLNSWLESVDVSTLPHAVILEGPRACGKTTFVKEIANKFGFNLKAFDSEEDIFENPFPTIYIIDCGERTPYNALLKTLEEPPISAYFVLETINSTSIPDTILNRCEHLYFQPYTLEFIRETLSNKLSEEECQFLYRTNISPFQVASSPEMLKAAEELANKFIYKVDEACLANALSISRKLSYKEGEEGIDVLLWLYMINNKLWEAYRSNNYKHDGLKVGLIAQEVADAISKVIAGRYDKKRIVELMILNVRKVVLS